MKHIFSLLLFTTCLSVFCKAELHIELNKKEMIKAVKDIKIKDMSGKNHWVKNIDVTSFDLDDISVDQVGSNLQVKVTNARGRLDADYRAWKKILFAKIRKSGRAKATFSGVTVTAAVGVLPNGKIGMTSCRPVIRSFKVRLYGSFWDWLLNMIIRLFDGKIKREVSKEICPALKKVVEKESSKIMGQIQESGLSFKL